MYCSAFDVRNALTPGAASGSTSGTAASLDDEQINDAIAQADARINGYLPKGYTVPMLDIASEDPDVTVRVAHPLVRFWSRDIAAYLATLTFKRNQDVSEDDPVRLRYNAAISDLTLVSTGKFVLPPDADSSDDSTGDVSVYNQYEGKLFGPEDFDLGYAGGNMRHYERHTHGMW